MLNRAICKRCIGRANPQWLEQDFVDDYWDEGFAACPFDGPQDSTPVDAVPPEWCPYAAEHVLSDEAKQSNL